jgi:nitroreductase
LPAGQRAAVILPLGYPAETPPRTTRRELSDLVKDLGI